MAGCKVRYPWTVGDDTYSNGYDEQRSTASRNKSKSKSKSKSRKKSIQVDSLFKLDDYTG